MSLDRLLFEVTSHYRTRGFPESALTHLRWTLLSNVDIETGRFTLKTAYPGCDASIGGLLGLFRPVEDHRAQDSTSATAVFGFAFGYQMSRWLDGTRPTDALEAEHRRLPGRNNEDLAKRAASINAQLKLPLLLQFEIADALSPSTPVAFASSRKDQGTFSVAAEFINHSRANGIDAKTVIIVAHRHHYERCRLVLERLGSNGLQEDDPYDGYDKDEAQPRVMSPEEYIVNDFASMAGMLGHK